MGNIINDKYSQNQDFYCNLAKGYMIFDDEVWNLTMTILSSLSCIMSTLLGIHIYANKNLQQHPATIIMFLSFVHGIFWFLALTNQHLCNQTWGEIFSYTVFFSDSPDDVYRGQQIVTMSYLWTVSFFTGTNSFIECILILDLYLNLSNPLKPPNTRYLKYLICGILYCSVFATLIAVTNYNSNSILNIVTNSVIRGIYFLVAVPSFLLTINTMRKPGLSKQYRELLFKRQILYCLLTIICQLDSMLSWLSTLGAIDPPLWFTKILCGYFSSAGIFYSLIRLTEPNVQNSLINSWYKLIGSNNYRNKSKNCVESTLNSFLLSQVNIEMVYTILKGITIFSQSDQNCQIDAKRDARTIQLDHLKIRNVSFWEDSLEKDVIQDDLLPFEEDFDASLKIREQRSASENLVTKKKIQVTSHFECSFQDLRQREGIDNDVIQKSLTPELNRDTVFKAGMGAGASGSFFFFSHDKRFIIKTMTDTELKLFRAKLSDDYFTFLRKHPKSLLARIYGIYTVKIEHFQAVNLILMDHSLKISNSSDIQNIYDIKGSTVNRIVKNPSSNTTTLKDLNFIKNNKLKKQISLDETCRHQILKRLIKDSNFLRCRGIMDYSLLLAIETIDPRGSINNENPTKFEQNKYVFTSRRGDKRYHISLIDFLQSWDTNKKLERFTKTHLLAKNKDGVSAVPPRQYFTRFNNFMRDSIFPISIIDSSFNSK